MVNFITSEERCYLPKIKFIPFRKQVLQGGGKIPTPHQLSLPTPKKKGKNHLKTNPLTFELPFHRTKSMLLFSK